MLQALLLHGDSRQLITWPTDKAQWEEGEGTLWIDLQSPSTEDVQGLALEFGLHPLVTRACLSPERRSRLKEFKTHLLLVLNAVARVSTDKGEGSDLRRFKPVELNVIVGVRYIITVHPEAVGAVQQLFLRYSRDGEGRPAVEHLLYTICDSVTLGYYSIMDRMDKHVEEIEKEIFTDDASPKLVDRLFSLKKHLLELRRVLGPQRDALGALMRRDFAILSPEYRSYFLDLYEHTLRVFDLLDTYRDLLSSSLDAYLTTVSNRTNEKMKLLTIVSTIMLPLTLITGIFGMNFGVMPYLDHPFGFWGVMIFLVGLGGSMLYYFRWRGWM